MSERTLLQQAARRDPTPVSPAELETAWTKIMDELGGEQQFLQNSGLTPADVELLRNNVELQIRVDRFIENLCRYLSKPTEQQLKAFYDENIQNFTTPEMVRAAHIVKHVDANTSPDQAKQAILEIQKELKSGKRFEELADGNSDCPGNGGDLGFFRRGKMVPRFEELAFSLQENEVSDIVQTEYGFHIVKVYEKNTAEESPFEQVNDKIFHHLHEQDRNTTVEQFLDEQRAKADVGELFSEKTATPADDKQNQHHASAQHEKTASKFRKTLSSVLVKPAGPDCNMAGMWLLLLS